MVRRGLPRIAALSGAEAARARHLVVHSPVRAGSDAVTWTLTLLADDGEPLAESRTTSPDYPLPISDIAQVHLDVVGLEAAGGWIPQQGAHGAGPRFRAAVRVAPAPPD
jgi:hypothetical protein